MDCRVRQPDEGLELLLACNGINLYLSNTASSQAMAAPENPMAYLLEVGLRRVEQDHPEVANDRTYQELKAQLLRDADGHFHEISATYATILKTQCHCGGLLEPTDHEFGRSQGTIYDSVIAKCRKCSKTQAFQFPKEGFISEARSAMALRDYLAKAYGIDYARLVQNELDHRPHSVSHGRR